ncbi:MAG: hypothetical protein SNH73_02545 [Rikenellaceae bacterium]
MNRFKNILLAAVAALMMIPSAIFAQSYGSINTFSPYSMYGLGEMSTQGTLLTRSMGGAGTALRSSAEINLLNPASYSITMSKSVLFSYGMEASNYFNCQTVDGSNVYNSYAAANFRDIALQIPVAEKLGVGFSVTPYSSSGYEISTLDYLTDVGLLSYTYEGGGDITQVSLGVGWEPFKDFSIGIAAKYYWGTLARSFTMIPYVVTGNGTYYSTLGESSYVVSSVKAQVGMQWSIINSSKENLVLGATYDLGGNLNPTYNHTVIGSSSLVYIVASSLSEKLPLYLPNKVAVGASYQNAAWILALDYTYEDWYSKNSSSTEVTSSGMVVAYNDFQTIKAGMQWTPNRNDVRNYFRRVSYRGGLRYGGYQQSFDGETIKQYAITAGAAFPLKMGSISKIDLSLEYGSRGSNDIVLENATSVGLIRQDYFKIGLGFTLFGQDYWFQRPKFD